MKAEIEDVLKLNLGRSRNLVAVYERVTGTGSGRRGTDDTDILRAAVVMLHATLEEFLRGIERWKLPTAPAQALKDVPLKGLSASGRAEKFWLSELAAFRGQSVEDVVRDSIASMLERSNYNNTADVAGSLERAGIKVNSLTTLGDLNDPMMRRHKIVHQADRQEQPGKGYGPAGPIDKPTVATWIDAVEAFAKEVMKLL